jgi:hypothetical protein
MRIDGKLHVCGRRRLECAELGVVGLFPCTCVGMSGPFQYGSIHRSF